VSLLDSLHQRGYLHSQQQGLKLSPEGETLFKALGADIPALSRKRRPLCKNCLDWSERRHHLAGSLGQWVLNDLLDKGWAYKDMDSRIIRFSAAGLKRFSNTYQLAL